MQREARRVAAAAATDVGDYINAGVQHGMDTYAAKHGLPHLSWTLKRDMSTGEGIVTGQVSVADFEAEARLTAAEEWAANLGLRFDFAMNQMVPDVLEWNGRVVDGQRIAVWVAPDRWRRETQDEVR